MFSGDIERNQWQKMGLCDTTLQAVKPFKCQPHRMVKHTQSVRRLLPTNCLSVFDHFVGLALTGLRHGNY